MIVRPSLRPWTALLLAVAAASTLFPVYERAASGDGEGAIATAADDNPYLAPEDLSPDELVRYLQRWLEKPESIRLRPGCLTAVIEAADRLLAATDDPELRGQALLAKFSTWRLASLAGDREAERLLIALAEELGADARPDVRREATFHLLEFRVLQTGPDEAAEIPELLAQLGEFFAAGPLEERHLGLAQGAVRVAGLLDDEAAQADAIKQFGEIFAGNRDRLVKRLGKRLLESPASAGSELVGQPLDLQGDTVDGTIFDWTSYRGKVVLVDFWATWCGPCLAELPNVLQTYDAWHARGFDVVGISLDEDREAIEELIKEREIPWVNLVGEGEQTGWKHPLALKYGIRSIPSTFLVGRDGRVVAVNVRGPRLAAELEKLLADQP